MSDYHILTQSQDEKTVQVIFHIPVPDILNEANVSYRTALKESLGTIESAYPSIDPAELTQLQDGEVLEKVRTIRWSRLGLTKTEKAAELDAAYSTLKGSILSTKQIELEWWGLDRDVP